MTNHTEEEILISVEEALALVLRSIEVLGLEKVDLLSSLGRVIGEDIYSLQDIPPWDNSAMDGYALRHDDIKFASLKSSILLKVVEDLPAGFRSSKVLKKGEAIKIMTGAPIPQGTDSVVMVEDTVQEDTRVKIFKSTEPGENIRSAGEDVRKGDLVISRGTIVGPAEVGMMASLGRSFILVNQRPQIAVLSTGDELVDVDGELGSSKIISSNSYSLMSQVKECGATPIQLGIARDRREALEDKFRQGTRADMIISSGGVSVGDYDLVKDVLKKMGMKMKFWKVAMKPGRPLAFGMIAGRPVFGLPGNPVSSMISFEQFVRPAILKMMGHQSIYRPIIDAVALENISKKSGRKHFIRAIVTCKDGVYYAASTGGQGSGILFSMVKADGLVILPEKATEVKAGEKVVVQLLNTNRVFAEKPGYP